MNPLTLVKRIQKINSTEASLGISEDASWHAKYKDSAYVYVGGIPFDLTEGDLLAVFSQYGEIVDVNLVRDKGTGKSKGFAFLAYEDQRSTILAVDNLNGAKLLDRIVRVDHVTKYKKKEEEDEEKEQQKREARGVCRAFQRGDCNRGAACKFSHDEQRSANTGWGAKDSGSRWDHDKYEGPSKRNRKPDHVASDYAPVTKVREEESKLSSADKDGWRSRAEGNDGDRRSHPKRSEPNLKDQDRREIEKRLEKYEKEPYAKENRDRQANEKGPRRRETEPDPKEGRDWQGSDKRSRYDQDEDKPNPKEDRERLGNEKRSRYSEDRDKTNPKDDWNRQGSEKRSRYNEDEDRPNPKEDRERQGSEKRSRYNEERDKMNPKEDRDRRVDEKRLSSIWRFLAVDPEIYPLLGVLTVTFGAAGYMLGKKGAAIRNEDPERIIPERPLPFRVDAKSKLPGLASGSNYRYNYHPSKEDNAVAVPVPDAVTEHKVKVKVPEEVAEKVSAAAKK